MNTTWPWITLVALGAYHGINPAMGWLFAVGLGLQERSRQAVMRAFVPIALGHALSVALVVALVGILQMWVAPWQLSLLGGSVLLFFGIYRLLSQAAHPRWVGMRIGFGDLTVWSFLMSTAHGAGLMLVPVLLGMETGGHDHADHAHHDHALMLAGMAAPSTELTAVLLHTLAMFVVMALTALIIYEKVGLRLLRSAWLNLDHLWTGAILLAGIMTMFGIGA